MKPTIARIWRGLTTRAKADEYAEFLIELPQGVQVLEIVSSTSASFRKRS